MDISETLKSAAASFERILRQYPRGVPKRVVKASPAPKVIFVYAMQQSQAETELLDAAVTKGLKLSLEAVSRISVAELRATDVGVCIAVLLGKATLTELGKTNPSLAAVDFQDALGKLIPWTKGSFVVVSHAVSDVLANQDTKREFWKHLQLLIPGQRG